MPFIINEDLEKEWLNPKLDASNITEFFRFGFTTKDFEAYSITKEFYKPKFNINTPGILHRVSHQELNYSQGKLF